MLLLDSARSVTIDGVPVFPDDVDPSQFWYLPSQVQLSRTLVDGKAAFSLIRFRVEHPDGTTGVGTFDAMKEAVRETWATEDELYQRVLAEQLKVGDIKKFLQ